MHRSLKKEREKRQWGCLQDKKRNEKEKERERGRAHERERNRLELHLATSLAQNPTCLYLAWQTISTPGCVRVIGHHPSRPRSSERTIAMHPTVHKCELGTR